MLGLRVLSHNPSELALPALPRNLQLQLLPPARRTLRHGSPRVFSQVPWLWERACLLEKVTAMCFFSFPSVSDSFMCLNKMTEGWRVALLGQVSGTCVFSRASHRYNMGWMAKTRVLAVCMLELHNFFF